MNTTKTKILPITNNGRSGQELPLGELILQRIKLRARRRILWLRTIWQQNGSAKPNYHTEVDIYLNHLDTPKAEIQWQNEQENIHALNKQITTIELKISKSTNTRLKFLEETFKLSQQESDFLQVCVALSLEANLGKVYAYLQDSVGKTNVTEEMVARLFGYGRNLQIPNTSSLWIWSLLIERNTGKGEPSFFECDSFICSWLLGEHKLDKALIGSTQLQSSYIPPKSWLKQKDIPNIISLSKKNSTTKQTNIHLVGSPNSGRRSFAAYLSEELGMKMLTLDVDSIPDGNWNQIYLRAQRQCLLNNWSLALVGEKLAQLNKRTKSIFNLPQFLIGESTKLLAPVNDVISFNLEIPPLSIEDRSVFWKQLNPYAEKWDKTTFDELIKRYVCTVGQIAAVAKKNITTSEHAASELNSLSRHQLGNLAKMLDCPFQWEDLILPEWLKHHLESFLFEATERALIWEESEAKRLFPQGKGLFALFTGSPGTGKTMTAQVIAEKLGLDLFRIDLSTIISKYVGETSKNIERILARARRMNAVLLFDEADTLFGKRTDIKDAHDRYANTDTNYLLQAIESYPGIVILASNKKSNIDGGFLRRLRYVLEFPKPDNHQRLLIWERIIVSIAGQKGLDNTQKHLKQLAEMVELTGAQIKYAVLSAIFIARQQNQTLAITHLLSGIERELMKEGRGISRQIKEKFK